jgi:quinol monooxygenase YgiN
MTVTYLIKFQVAPERRDQFLKLLDGVLDAMREEPTFHEAILHGDPGSEDHFMLYGTWESHEDVVNVQLRRPYGALGMTRSPSYWSGNATSPSGSPSVPIASRKVERSMRSSLRDRLSRSPDARNVTRSHSVSVQRRAAPA